MQGGVDMFRAGLTYFAVVFAFGMAFGVMRNTLLAPRLGVTASVILELPVMLLLSWLACGAILRRTTHSGRIRDRVIMGAVALAFLWLSEALLAIALGASAAGFFASFATPAGALGALAQIAFAAFPLLRRWTG
ncbi:hypothetical protein ACFP76_14025 [Paracoccus aerius]|nr:hypothetical protein GCM10017322_36000 [Paracoccus aerius]